MEKEGHRRGLTSLFLSFPFSHRSPRYRRRRRRRRSTDGKILMPTAPDTADTNQYGKALGAIIGLA